jgi:hypothetical protein
LVRAFLEQATVACGWREGERANLGVRTRK